MTRRGLANRRLADLVGVSAPPVGEWLKGTNRPRPETALKLAELFGVQVSDLLDDTRDLPPSAYPVREVEDPVVQEQASSDRYSPEFQQELLARLKAIETRLDAALPAAIAAPKPDTTLTELITAVRLLIADRQAAKSDESKKKKESDARRRREAERIRLRTPIPVPGAPPRPDRDVLPGERTSAAG